MKPSQRIIIIIIIIIIFIIIITLHTDGLGNTVTDAHTHSTSFLQH